MTRTTVAIIGGGLAGLSCARTLDRAGVDFLLLEAADGFGGRVQTDEVEGFLLDRGFQVLLTAYPECRDVLDYEALDLGTFDAGALVRRDGRFHRLADPWRAPVAAFRGVFSPVGSLADKLRVGRLRMRLRSTSLERIFRRPERSTREALAAEGFSPAMVDSFFRPFFGGIFLEPELATSSRMFEFVFKMFAEGSAALPAAGMRAIPDQVAGGLPTGSLRASTRVVSVENGRVALEGGEEIGAERIVVATDAAGAARLLPGLPARSWNATTCFYFDAAEAPIAEPILALDGEEPGSGRGPINNLCVPSAVRPGYAPPGRALVSVTVVGADREPAGALEGAVRAQLGHWFGSMVESWRTLATYPIPYALPAQAPPALEPVERPARHGEGLYLCGDHLDTASIHGAMVSGRRAAEAVLEDLG